MCHDPISLYSSACIPAMQNKLYISKIEALEAPSASLDLIQNNSGLVFNRSFNSDVVQYDDTYQNDQGYSPHFQEHLNYVCSLCANFLSDKDSLVVDVGCGKGGFVHTLRNNGINAVGYDYTYQGSSPFIEKSFFNINSHHKGDLLTLRHVLEHIPSPWQFLEDIAKANAYSGLLYIEVPDLDWILLHRAYFDLFHEHVNYFRLDDFLSRFGDAVVLHSNTFGGQYLSLFLRLDFFRYSSSPPFFPSTNVNLFESFSNLSYSESLAYSSLHEFKQIVVWGAASKGVIFAARSPDALKHKFNYAIDINPMKHRHFMPLSGVEVVDPKSGLAMLTASSVVIIMNPNYEREIRDALPSDQPTLVLH